MKRLTAFLVALLLLGFVSTASAGWCAPNTVTYGYYPVGPVYTYQVASPVVVGSPCCSPATSYYAPAPVVYRAYYRPVWVPGQPVRNVIRRALP